jgi:ABC-type transport system substrate-binding protein
MAGPPSSRTRLQLGHEAVGHYRELLPLLERRGAGQEMALILFKLALALHTSLRFAEADAAYRQAFALWRPPPPPVAAAKTLRVASNVLPDDADPHSAITWVNIQLGMQLFDRLVEAWPERTIVPCLAERWEIAAEGLRYLFRLHAGLRWSDDHPLTAHDVEFAIKRVLDPGRPGASAAIYFVLENGLDYCAGRERDHRRVGVAALDERTVEFRLEAPAPYFLSVLNRPRRARSPATRSSATVRSARSPGGRWSAAPSASRKAARNASSWCAARTTAGPGPATSRARR